MQQCFCGGAAEPLISGMFYVRGDDGARTDLDTVLYRCRRCDLVTRDLDYTSDLASTHFELASYTQPATAEDWRLTREPFFSWLLGLAVEHLGQPPTALLDFGCAHGHMLDLAAAQGVRKTAGVEVAPQMVEALTSAGRHEVHTSLSDGGIPDGAFDAVVAIDSIYYVEGDPQDLLASLGAKLRPGGILVTRTANRNQVYRLLAARWRLLHGRHAGPAPVSYRIVGDAKFGFSERALATRYAQAGLERVAVRRWERGRSRTRKRLASDAAAWVMHRVSLGRVDLCTGLVVVARKTR